MNDMNFSFNSMGDVKAHTGQRVVPDSGDYNVMLSDITMDSNRAGDGHNIIVTYSILDGDFAGSELKEWLAVINKNETAQNIAQSKLKAIYLVTGKTSAKSFTELAGTVLRIRVLKKPNKYIDNNGNEREGHNNEVAMYMDTNGRNPEGKDVAPYNGPAIVAASGNSKKNNAGNQSSNSVKGDSYGSPNVSKSDDNYDDEIPF